MSWFFIRIGALALSGAVRTLYGSAQWLVRASKQTPILENREFCALRRRIFAGDFIKNMMADRRKYEPGNYYAVHQQPRNRAFDFETELNKYCTDSDIRRYKLCKDSQGNYNIIGSGAFGKVYEAFDNSARRPVALKVMKKDHILSNRLERRVIDEIRIHSKLMHPRIVEMYECFHDKSRIYIALELCPGGDLEHYLRRGVLSEEIAASIFRQVVEGVLYLHRVKTSRDGSVVGNPILHRDLKPSNICFTNDISVKLCDFNLAAEVISDSQRNTTYCGTPGYMPPEVSLNLPYSFEVDVYGLGCVLYCMLFGYPPGNARNEGSFDVHIPNGVSGEAENLLRNLLSKDGRQRMSVKAIAKDQFLLKFMQRKRLASIDSGFDTQHTGSSFPDHSRRAMSRERYVPRAGPGDVNNERRMVPMRVPHPAAFDSVDPPAPPSNDFPLRAVRGLPPPLNGQRPNSRRFASPAPQCPSNRNYASYDHPRFNQGLSTFDNAVPSSAALPGDDPGPSRRPRSPVASGKRTERGQASGTKVRYVSNVVQCAYMNNGEFIAKFSGGKVAMKKGNSSDVVVALDRRKAELTRLEEAHFQKVLRIVRALEQVCETECGVNAECDCFPVLLDKRRSSPHNA